MISQVLRSMVRSLLTESYKRQYKVSCVDECISMPLANKVFNVTKPQPKFAEPTFPLRVPVVQCDVRSRHISSPRLCESSKLPCNALSVPRLIFAVAQPMNVGVGSRTSEPHHLLALLLIWPCGSIGIQQLQPAWVRAHILRNGMAKAIETGYLVCRRCRADNGEIVLPVVS